jgi:hypothetical protein
MVPALWRGGGADPIEGQAPLTPLILDKVGKGSFKGLAVLDRWMINPQLTSRIKTLGPNLGKPEFYDIVTTAQGLPPGRAPQPPDSYGWCETAVPAENHRKRMGMSIVELL